MMRSKRSCRWLLAVAALVMIPAAGAHAQQQVMPPRSDNNPVVFQVERSSQRLEMVIHSSRILTHEGAVPRVLVNNPDIVQATPLSPNQIQLSARRTGVTQVNLWDKDQNVYTVDVIVTADARELEELLRTEFPQAEVRVRPLANSVVLTGYVPSPEMIGRIVTMSQDYYSQVINNLEVGGVQQIMLHVKIIEVSRSKLRQLGIDWAVVSGNDVFVSNPSGLVQGSAGQGMMGSTVNINGSGQSLLFAAGGADRFFAYVDALRQNNLAKLLSEPTLVTVSGRPASFIVGGEFPITVPQSLGTVSIEYRSFGTRVDFLPIVLGNGNIRLEVRPQVTERDDAAGIGGVPAITSRWVDTAVEMKAGQTLALAGLLQNRLESENRGIPGLADIPWAGAWFRRVDQRINEVELLVIVRPEFVDAVYPHEAPQCYPGQFTKPPSPHDFYGRGYMEVPKCCNDGSCPQCLGGASVVYPEDAGGMTTPGGTLPAPEQGTMRLPVQPGQAISRPAAVHIAPQNQQNPQGSRAGGGAQETTATDPQLLGPMGYDVLDFKN